MQTNKMRNENKKTKQKIIFFPDNVEYLYIFLFLQSFFLS